MVNACVGDSGPPGDDTSEDEMRHQVSGYKLGRNDAQRRALMRNLISQLFLHGRIQTTEAKARAIRSDAEKLITIAKNGLRADGNKVHARRLVAARINGVDAAKKLFDEIAPRFETRPGGYTRLYKLGMRQGDGAEMAIIELVQE
jgi:large subunit ribosomal protein L17